MLRFPRALWIVAALAFALSLPSVFADFYCDDQGMVLRLEHIGPSPAPGPFRLYTFVPGDAGDRALLVDHGPLPWWTADGLRLSFFRPLSSALFAADHAIAGRHPLLYHLHSIAWYVAAVLAAAALFRRLLPEREAAVAAILFAASPAHWMLSAWPSARHVAVSGTFAFVALGIHLRAREQNAPRARVAKLTALALVAAAVALAGGETALGLFAYVAAYEIFGRKDAIAGRVRALIPWFLLFVGYAAIYRGLGFGVRGSGAYIDPLGQPAEYLAALPARLAVFAGAALACVPSELSAIAPAAVPTLATIGLAAIAVFAMLLRRAVRTLGEDERRTIRWLLVGALLSVAPGAAGIPGDRILFLPNLGVLGALSVILLRAGAKGRGSARVTWGAWPARAGVALFAFLHVIAAPLLFAFGGAQLASTSHAALALASSAQIPARDGVKVFGIGLEDPLIGMYLGSALYLAPRPAPLPRAIELLSMAAHDHRVRREDERTLEITVIGGTLLEGPFEYVVRPPNEPLRASDVLTIGEDTVRILEDIDGRPTRFAVTFDRPVDDPSIVLLVWRGGALRALTPPAIGEDVLVKHEKGPMGF